MHKKTHLCCIISHERVEAMTDTTRDWNEQKNKLKEKFAQLTDKDVFLIEGRENDLIGRLESKLGKTKEEIQKIISGL